MTTFTLELMSEINGIIDFYRLFRNEKCLFDEFFEEVNNHANTRMRKQLLKLLVLLDNVANGHHLPPNKFRELKGYEDGVKEYEVKTSDLRAYFFKDKRGRLVLSAGWKKNQKADIRQFRKIKKEYLKNQN